MLKCCPSLSRLPESAIIRPYRTGIPTDSSRLITAMAVAQDSHLYFPVAVTVLFLLFYQKLPLLSTLILERYICPSGFTVNVPLK